MRKVLAIWLWLSAPVFGQTETLPELKLNVPSSVQLSRLAKFTIDPIVAPEKATYTISMVSIDWVIVQKANAADPLENDAWVDRLDGTQAAIPTGPTPTLVSINVTATLLLKNPDGKERFAKIKTHKDVPIGNPLVDPVVPTPVVPVPAPVVADPTLPDGKYKLAAWTYKTLKDSRAQPNPVPITKAEAATIANGWHQVAQMARNNPQITMDQVVNNIAEANRNNSGKNLANWITVFFEPVHQKLNQVNRAVTSVADQAQTYDEIGNGLDAWSKQP